MNDEVRPFIFQFIVHRSCFIVSPSLTLPDAACNLHAAPDHRYAVARVLVENGYEAFVAEDTTQAIERMREDKMAIVILDPGFDSVEQGAAFIRREISALRPAARRRLFFVVVSPELRTGDAHLAFVNHANLALNPSDVEDLPALLDRSIRDFNELYRDFNKALQVADF